MLNTWNCTMNVLYHTVLLQETELQQKSSICTHSFPIYSPKKTTEWPWKFSSFLSDYYRFVSYRPRSALIFPIYLINIVYFLYLTFSLFFLYFHVPSPLTFFPFLPIVSQWAFLNFVDFWLNNSFLCKRIAHLRNVIHEISLYIINYLWTYYGHKLFM